MRVAVDMDEVIADTARAKRALYGRLFGYRWSDDDLRGVKLDTLVEPAHAAAMETELHKGGFFAAIDVMEGAREALAEIAERHEVFIATAAMEYPASCVHKTAWLERHFPFLDPMRFVFCGDKSVVRADALIDDKSGHFESFVGIGICFDALHNQGADVAHRLTGWAEAPALLDRLDAERGAGA
ncbi:hypothetical protein E2L08_01040 [Palleronia sediminis]|uniref:Uncharacterized protein n=1 Tax=Palleronia sediminis TaxID=2547833 RepID=A0A4R6ANE0_9RHOB|nr:hypothetical protein [Palleronia sediminis]TDL84088.1 hypothetical protein E2L08_01040 [Palleronia sediminis]